MTENEQREFVYTTERQIACLLADLEKQMGCFVDGLALRDPGCRREGANSWRGGMFAGPLDVLVGHEELMND